VAKKKQNKKWKTIFVKKRKEDEIEKNDFIKK